MADDTLAVICAGAVPVIDAGSTGGAAALVVPAAAVVAGGWRLNPAGMSATPVLAPAAPTTVAPPLAELVPALTLSDPADETDVPPATEEPELEVLPPPPPPPLEGVAVAGTAVAVAGTAVAVAGTVVAVAGTVVAVAVAVGTLVLVGVGVGLE